MTSGWGQFFARSRHQVLFIALLWFTPASTVAQEVPSDLSDLSLEELMDVEFRPESPSGHAASNEPRWKFSYDYRRARFDGYRDGSSRLSNETVLFDPTAGDVRTNSNFPVIPDSIVQEVHAMNAVVTLTATTSLSVTVPYVRQKTDHISIVPGFAAFTIRSDGLGDVSVSAAYRVWRSRSHQLFLNGGISFPTGSIDEKGDTPRPPNPGKEQLPYTMQLGSGTYDIPVGIGYAGRSPHLSWGSQLRVRMRLGENDRNYRLGSRKLVSGWLGGSPTRWLTTAIKAVYRDWGRIHGADTELQVPGPFIFPAPVTNPRLFGGKKINLSLNLRFDPQGKMWAHQTFELEIGGPVYQSLNGPQTEEDTQIRFGWSFRP